MVTGEQHPGINPAAKNTVIHWIKLGKTLKGSGPLKPLKDDRFPFLQIFEAESDKLHLFRVPLADFFGEPFKKSGASGFWLNWFNPVVKATGGIQRDQTLYSKEINKELFVYCAFWPWGSNPKKTSIRLGILPFSETYQKEIENSINYFKKK